MSDLHYIPGVDPPYKILTEEKLKEFATSKDIPITNKTGGTGYCPTYSEVEDYLGDKRTYRLFFKKEPKYKDNELIWEVDFTTGLKKRTVEWTPHPGTGPTVPSSGGQSCAQVSLDKTVKLDGVVYAEESKTFGPEQVCHTFPSNNSRTSPSASECYTFVDSEEDYSEQVCANFNQEAAPEYALHWDFNGGTPTGSYTPDGSTLLEGESITYPTDITRGQDTFLGWTPAPPLSMPASSLTITANWEVFVPDESITWIPVHGELSGNYTTSGKPGDPLIQPTHPIVGDVVDGYTCTGWDPTPGSTIPSGGATYTALWTDPVIPEPEDELESITSASGNKLTYGKIPAAGTAIPKSELILNFVLHYSISGDITKSYNDLGLTPTFEASEILSGTGGAISSSDGNASANANTGAERDVCKSTASVSGTYNGISVNGSITSAMIKQSSADTPTVVNVEKNNDGELSYDPNPVVAEGGDTNPKSGYPKYSFKVTYSDGSEKAITNDSSDKSSITITYSGINGIDTTNGKVSVSANSDTNEKTIGTVTATIICQLEGKSATVTPTCVIKQLAAEENIKYHLSWDFGENGYTNSSDYTQEGYYEENYEIKYPSNMSMFNPGYRFTNSWTWIIDGSNKLAKDTMPNSDVIIKANWEKESTDLTWSIVFSADGNRTAYSNAKFVNVENDIFSGTYDNGYKKGFYGEYSDYANIISYPNELNNVTISPNTDNYICTTTHSAKLFMYPEDPICEGYVFKGWEDHNTHLIYLTGDPITMHEFGTSVLLNAIWENNQVNFTFDLNGGTIIDSSTLPPLISNDPIIRTGKPGNQVTEPSGSITGPTYWSNHDLMSKNANFVGWTTNPDAIGLIYQIGETESLRLTNFIFGSNNITVYALYEKGLWDDDDPTGGGGFVNVIHWNSNGGRFTKGSSDGMNYASNIPIGENISILNHDMVGGENLPNPESTWLTREGYIFDSWNSKADGSGTKLTEEVTVNVGLTIGDISPSEYAKWYAQWKEN